MLRSLFETRELLNRWFGESARVCQLTETQWRVLQVLLSTGPKPVVRLAEASSMSSSNTIRVLKQLERNGMALRNRFPQDKRIVIVALTCEGRAMATKPMPKIADFSGRLASGFGRRKLEELCDLLDMVAKCKTHSSIPSTRPFDI